MNRYIALQKVVELESLTKAAEALGYTQSAMSQMITSLENELSIKLVNRFRSGTELTPEGRELYPQIEQLVYQYRAVQEKTQEIKGLESGIIRMATFSSVSTQWLPKLLKEFQLQYPAVKFVVHQGDYKTHLEMIKTGAVDFAFVRKGACSGIETMDLKVGRMLAVLPTGHPLAAREAVPLDLLAKETFILLEEGDYYEPLEAFSSRGVVPNVQYTMHDDHAIMAMVQEGLGVSILAELMLQDTLYDLALRPTTPPITRTLTIGYKSKASLSMASRRFLRCLNDHLNQLP